MAMKTLLVALDFSDASAIVIGRAAELAQELSGRIVLLHVVEPKAAFVPAGKTKRAVAAAWPLRTPRSQAKLEARLNSLAEPLRSSGLKVESLVVSGLLMDEILEQSVKYHADYIILGSHGKSAAQHLVTGGSAFTGMLGRLKCPLLIVPVKTGGK
jgi:nucleotide-binding universal stress UspA family protein